MASRNEMEAYPRLGPEYDDEAINMPDRLLVYGILAACIAVSGAALYYGLFKPVIKPLLSLFF